MQLPYIDYTVVQSVADHHEVCQNEIIEVRHFGENKNAVQACLGLTLRPCLYRDSLK